MIQDTNGLVVYGEIREKIDKLLRGRPKPEEVGTTPEAIEGQRAMMNLFGG